MTTEARTKEFTVLWKIKDYYKRCSRISEGHCFGSELFEVEDLSASQWGLEIYPLGYKDNRYVTCGLRNYSMGAENMNINCIIDVIDENNQPLRSHFYLNVMYINGGVTILDPLIEIYQLRANMTKWKSDTLTLRCRIQNSGAETQYEINPRIDFEQCEFLWKLEPILSISAFEVSFTETGEDIWMSIKRTRDSFQKLKCKIGSCVYYTYPPNNTPDQWKCYSHNFDSNHNVWKFPTYLTKTICNGSISTHFKFAASNNISSERKIIFVDKNPKVPLIVVDTFSSLTNDLRCLYKDKRRTDVNLRVGNEIIPTHKLILIARSPVFAAMFDQDMAESKTSEVNITDLDIDTVNSFLEFVYTGKVDNMCYESATKLLLVADKYQVPSLGEKCSNFLMSVLSAENACDVLTMADMFRQEFLKEAASDCIKNNASKILSASEWPLWLAKNCKLGSEIVCKLSMNLSNLIKK